MREQADRRFDEALRETGARDPRDFYRRQLRQLKEGDPAAYKSAIEYYERTLIPAVAAEGSDPLGEWLEFGRRLSQLQSDGATMQIDPTGKGSPYAPPVPLDHLVLHLPTSARKPALAIGIPKELSPAQQATYDLLVRHRVAS